MRRVSVILVSMPKPLRTKPLQTKPLQRCITAAMRGQLAPQLVPAGRAAIAADQPDA